VNKAEALQLAAGAPSPLGDVGAVVRQLYALVERWQGDEDVLAQTAVRIAKRMLATVTGA
jgi:hypothetical protein